MRFQEKFQIIQTLSSVTFNPLFTGKICLHPLVPSLLFLPPFFKAHKSVIMPGVNWPKSAAKVVIEDDLRAGILPTTAAELKAKDAWDLVYSHLVEFHGVEYEQFHNNLNRMCQAHRKKINNVEWAKNAIEHDKKF